MNSPTRTRIRHRSELILYARGRELIGACRKAFITGAVEVLGGFAQIPPSPLPGWILRITSRYQTWLVAVAVDENTHEYLVWHPPYVPWRYWSGQVGRKLNIYDGDQPNQAAMKWWEAQHAV